MYETVFLLSCIKLMWIPTYRSTDFEVHRNWLAITHSLPIKNWYEDETSEWTLDYPPFFAWFEYLLSQIAVYFDPKMLEVQNLNYGSNMTIVFQKISVVVTDLLFAYALKQCICEVGKKIGRNCHELSDLFLIIFGNAGLLLVDHIHFQYNGFLFGLLFLSFARILQGRELSAAFWFAVLLNFKHIYLYMAPAYFVYLFRSFCFSSTSKNEIKWMSFSVPNFLKLAAIVGTVFAVSFGPFVALGQLGQVLTRLFPFKRGLSHAYWAPNFWALYNVIDKLAAFIGSRSGLLHNLPKASMTGGLVQEFKHSVLPSVTPLDTFVLTFISMVPALLSLWRHPHHPWQFIRTATMCSFCSFLFGWHVHEKAILLVTLPLGLLCLVHKEDAKLFFFLSIIGNFSLFPLIFKPNETIIKVTLLLLHAIFTFGVLSNSWKWKKGVLYTSSKIAEILFLLGLSLIFIYEQFIHNCFSFAENFKFLPLMLISVYCSIGIIFLWILFYYNILLTSIHIKSKSK